jgi:hypothetical protein
MKTFKEIVDSIENIEDKLRLLQITEDLVECPQCGRLTTELRMGYNTCNRCYLAHQKELDEWVKENI